jgi:glycerophosphoryl diester phosphodiesterase
MLYTLSDAEVRMQAFRLLHMVARRGNSHEFPDNTLAALRSAIQLGARFIELDVHLSADGTPMVVNDRELAKVADFESLTAAQLGALHAGQPARFGDRFSDTRIASLATTLSVLEGRPELTAFIIIGRACVLKFGRDHVISRVMRTLQPVRSRCVLGSSDLATVHAARTLAGYPIAWVLPTYDNHTRLKYEALQPDYLFCDQAFLPAAGPLWRGPWRWVIHEVNSLEAVLALAARGAQFVATREVRSLSEALRAHAAAEAAARDPSFTGTVTRW